MKALVCRAWGPPESLVVDELPDPTPGEGDVIVRVAAAGVNFPDTLVIQRKYQIVPPLPFSPGSECAGTVESVGARVTHVHPGDRVAAFTAYGAFAEKVRCDARMVVPVPASLDLAVAAGFLTTYGTSYHALADRGALAAGETLLVLGASGGVGLAAVEIGAAMGARVIAAASSPTKLAICREHGASEVIDYSAEDLKARVKELTGGAGADVVYDPVGGATTETALRACAWRGRLLVVGFAAGDIPKLPANLMLLKGCAVVGVHWGDYGLREPERFAADVRILLDWLAAGRLHPLISGRYPLERGAEALRALLDRRVSGKLVIDVAPA